MVLLEIDKSLEIDFYYTVLSFDLAISLQIKGAKESMLDAKEVAEQ